MKTQTEEQLILSLPEGFTARGATLDDVEPALKLYNRWSQSVIHEDETTDIQAIRNEWVSPGFDPAEDIHLVFAPDGQMVGYIEAWTTAKPPVHPWIWGRVDPRYKGLGIGTYLLTWGETRARRALDEVPAELRFAPRVGIFQQAVYDEGYRGESEQPNYEQPAPPSSPRIERILASPIPGKHAIDFALSTPAESR